MVELPKECPLAMRQECLMILRVSHILEDEFNDSALDEMRAEIIASAAEVPEILRANQYLIRRCRIMNPEECSQIGLDFDRDL